MSLVPTIDQALPPLVPGSVAFPATVCTRHAHPTRQHYIHQDDGQYPYAGDCANLHEVPADHTVACCYEGHECPIAVPVHGQGVDFADLHPG